MNKEELFKKHNEMLDKGKEETEKWILALSDEEFKLLFQLPIISQAKIWYKEKRSEK